MLSGRFAPSPTGPLHMGSLTTALASYLDITTQGGTWHIRIDDIDTPREAPEAKDQILSALAAHGLTSASPVRYQSAYSQRYQSALSELESRTFHCRCSRAHLKGIPIYPGFCRTKNLGAEDASLRLRVDSTHSLIIEDAYENSRSYVPAQDVGDFIVRRRDGLWAYNFATAVDDGNDFTHVLRGQDLSHTTVLQIIIMKLLNLEVPTYSHIPLLYFDNGQKLSKHTHAPALDSGSAANNLAEAFYYLGCQPPNEPEWSIAQWLQWGINMWPQHEIPMRLPIYRAKPA